jgi:hypothetical protein
MNSGEGKKERVSFSTLVIVEAEVDIPASPRASFEINCVSGGDSNRRGGILQPFAAMAKSGHELANVVATNSFQLLEGRLLPLSANALCSVFVEKKEQFA